MPKRDAARPSRSRRTDTRGMRAALVHSPSLSHSRGASRGLQKSTVASSWSWKRAMIQASSAMLARVQVHPGWANISNVARETLRATVAFAGQLAGVVSRSAPGVLLYLQRTAKPAVTASSQAAAAAINKEEKGFARGEASGPDIAPA